MWIWQKRISVNLRLSANIPSLTDLNGSISGGAYSRENQVLQLVFRQHSFCSGRKLSIPKKISSKSSIIRHSIFRQQSFIGRPNWLKFVWRIFKGTPTDSGYYDHSFETIVSVLEENSVNQKRNWVHRRLSTNNVIWKKIRYCNWSFEAVVFVLEDLNVPTKKFINPSIFRQ